MYAGALALKYSVVLVDRNTQLVVNGSISWTYKPERTATTYVLYIWSFKLLWKNGKLGPIIGRLSDDVGIEKI